MSEYDKNFTFRMPGELREAITLISKIEDRSMSQLAEYLLWAGFDKYCKEKRLLSALEVRDLKENYKEILAGLNSQAGQDAKRLLDLIQVEERAS